MGIALKLPQGRRSARRKGDGRLPLPGRDGQPQGKAARARRSAGQGATRKVAPSTRPRERRGLRWLERVMILVAVGVVLAAAVQGWAFLQSLPVQRISVLGELEHTRTEAIREMVQPELAGGFLGADLQQMSERLQALPWVYRATARRVWPNSLEIIIDEELPIARWGDGGFLNHEGQLFRPSGAQDWNSLPQLHGPERAAPALMRTYQRLVDMLSPLGLKVTDLSVDERGQIEAVLAGGQQLVIGGSDFSGRMQRFTRVYRAELAQEMERVQRVDLRYAHGVAVAFSENAEPPADSGDNDSV